jgi:Zn-dependent M28 family amino/carboxypeptidase
MLKLIIAPCAGLLAVMLILVSFWWHYYLKMPGRSYHGPLLPLSADEQELSHELETHVQTLSGEIGERNWLRPAQLAEAAAYIEQCLRSYGYKVELQEYEFHQQYFHNIISEKPGTTNPDEIIVVGAHYDSVVGCPGANDNSTGVACLLTLARLVSRQDRPRTIRFVAFANEEQPFFDTEGMGSYQYAQLCRKHRERIRAMLSLETMGYYRDDPNSQDYPTLLRWFYPNTGNFVAFVSNLSSRHLVHTCVASFRKHASFPCEGGSAPSFLPGIDWSDHFSFSAVGYPALMVTDTALFRYPHYHTADDTARHNDFDKLALVTNGIFAMLHDLAGSDPN